MPRTALILAGVVTALAASTVLAQRPAKPAVTVFERARLILGDGSPLLEDAVFVVEGDRFAAVGPRGGVKLPVGATRVDLIGKTVMPAIIDTETPLAATREALSDELHWKAYWGAVAVTSASVGLDDLTFKIAGEISPDSARLLAAGRIPYAVKSEVDARSTVRDLAAKGVNLVRISLDGETGTGHRLSPALYGAVIAEAHASGLRVIAHISTLADAKEMLRAGADALGGAIRDKEVDDELVAMFRERPGAYYVPSLPERGGADFTWLRDTVPAGQLKTLQAASIRAETWKVSGVNLSRLYRVGVRIALGSGSGDGWSHHLEMADMDASGMAPVNVIDAATQNAAELVGLKDHGAIRPGSVANFLVLNDNAGIDISQSRNIADVYFRGGRIDRAALLERWKNRTR